MITRLLTLLAVLCCFSFSSNAQTIIDGDPIALNLGDDQWSNIDLGFDVTYFGETFDSITVYTNGMTLFGDNRGNADNCCNGYKPTQDQHDYGIFPFWTDLITINNNDEYNGVYYLSDSIDTLQIGWINMQEYYNNQTNNTFGLEIKSTSNGVSIDFLYDELEINNHSIWSGLTGDVSEGEVIENFFHNRQSGLFSGDSNLDWSYTYIDCSNPLNDPSCEGYQQAYTEQQCQQDPLYDQSCSGYEQAYTQQQCQSDPLYDPSCDGYESAYEDQQCSQDPLWSPKCSGYQMAYDDQQCRLDPQYSPMCLGYKFEEEEFKFESFGFEDFSQGNFVEEEFFFEPESFAEDFIFQEPELEFTPELDEFFPENIKEEITELEKRIEEESEEEIREFFEEVFEEDSTEEEIREGVPVINETTSEETSDTPRRSGSRVGLSVGLGTANSLISGLISNSIESGQSAAAQGVGTGGYFESGTTGVSKISSAGVSFGEFANTITSDNQIEVETSIVLKSISIGIQLDTQMVETEVKEPTLAEKIAERTRKKNLEAEGGIFSKQESVLSNIANRTDLTKYYDEKLSDADSFYVSEQVYKNAVLADNSASLWRMTNKNYGLMNDLVRSQYGE